MIDKANDDRLRRGELIVSDGGLWRGLLFDNPKLGLPPELTWSFTFTFADVSRAYGSSPVSMDIDWVFLHATDWRRMIGQRVQIDQFAEPAEASVYFFEHHRYNAVDLRILDQRGAAILVTAVISGDLDELGMESLAVTSWLTFAGITVQLSAGPSVEESVLRLRDFTDVSALTSVGGTPLGVLFGPADPPTSEQS